MAALHKTMVPPQIDLDAINIGKIEDYYSAEQQGAILNSVRRFLQPGSEKYLLADVCRAAQEYQTMREVEDIVATREKLEKFQADIGQAGEALQHSFSMNVPKDMYLESKWKDKRWRLWTELRATLGRLKALQNEVGSVLIRIDPVSRPRNRPPDRVKPHYMWRLMVIYWARTGREPGKDLREHRIERNFCGPIFDFAQACMRPVDPHLCNTALPRLIKAISKKGISSPPREWFKKYQFLLEDRSLKEWDQDEWADDFQRMRNTMISSGYFDSRRKKVPSTSPT